MRVFVKDAETFAVLYVSWTDDLADRYDLDETTYDTMVEELRRFGRYWLTAIDGHPTVYLSAKA